jgi:biotin carboxylase
VTHSRATLDLPLLVVVYDLGSVAPMRIAECAARIPCRVAFVCGDSPHATQMQPVLEYFGAAVLAAEDRGPRLAAAVARLAPAGVVTFSEREIPTVAGLAAALGLPYQALADIPAITTKAAQRARLCGAGVDELPVRRVVSPQEAEDALREVGLPVVVKPDLGMSSRNTVLVTREDDYRAVVRTVLAAEGAAVIVERALEGRPTPAPWGDYIAVDCVAAGGTTRPVFTTGKFGLAEPFRERGGYGPPLMDATELADIEQLAVRAVDAVGITCGVADVEIKLTAAGPRVIEVNGRLGAWVDDLAMRSGLPSPAELAMRVALGLADEGVPERAAPDGVAFHYLVVSPLLAARIRQLAGVEAVRRLPGVDRVVIEARPDDRVDWRRGTAGSTLAVVTGVAPSHDAVAQLVTEIESAWHVEYVTEEPAEPESPGRDAVSTGATRAVAG